MSFSADWLALREPFDHQARSARLAAGLDQALAGVPAPWRLLELGGGTGSGVRWLAPRLSVPSRFVVADHDPALLAHAATDRVTPSVMDLRDFEGWPERVDAVTLQAVLDLVDLGFLHQLADAVAARAVPVLAALSVDGRVTWTPEHPDDAAVQSAFRLHQLGDRGFGDSVGPFAGAIFADLLRVRGFTVTVDRADWVVGRHDRAMLVAMIDGTAEAAAEMSPSGVDVDAWAASRRGAADAGTLTLRVGHLDVLGCPARP